MVVQEKAVRWRTRRGPLATRRNLPKGSLPIDEIQDMYPGEWVLVKVTGESERGVITHGEVLAHGRSRKMIGKVVIRVHHEDPSVHTYVFPGGHRPKTREEWAARLGDAIGTPSLNGWL